MTLSLQSKIIINISVGIKHASDTVQYEEADGTVSDIPLALALDSLITENIKRTVKPIHLIFPEFSGYNWWPSDWRHIRNIRSFRAALQKIIDERRSSKT